MLVLLLIIATLSSVSPTDLPQRVVVEVLFVVEPQVIRNYMKVGYDKQTAETNVRGDIDYILNEVNQLFASMEKYGLPIEVRAKKLVMMTDEMFEDCKLIRHNDIQVDLGMEVFREWLKVHEPMEDNGKYDMALLWTGYDAFSSGGRHSTLGYATISAICSKYALGIVEFDGTHETATTTAHEIAHSLGATHEGQNNECSAQAGYVMTAVSRPRFQSSRWEFSHCSAQSITNNLVSLDNAGRNCLLNTTTPAANFAVASQANRDILDGNKVCQRERNNPKGYMCTGPNLYQGPAKGDVVCNLIYCGIVGGNGCMATTPTEHMICDAGQRCLKGKCVPAPATLPVPAIVRSDCVYGDVKSEDVFGSGLTCQGFLQRNGTRQCYWGNVERTCCQSCFNKQYSIQGCKYGDNNPQCAKYTASSRFCSKNGDICCYTCRNYHRAKRSLVEELSPAGELDDVIIEPDSMTFEPIEEVIEDEQDIVPYSME